MKNQLMFASLAAATLLSACTTNPGKAPASAANHTFTPVINIPPDNPLDMVRAPADQALVFELAASGVQIYDCRVSKDDSKKFEWVFRAPEAELFDSNGKKVGKHYGGPTWEASDGSKVVGEVVAKNDAPDANAIPWLLLNAKANAGNGRFTRISSIQRVATVGGKAPVKGCSDFQLGAEARVPYKATYNFYKVN